MLRICSTQYVLEARTFFPYRGKDKVYNTCYSKQLHALYYNIIGNE